jgi:hypothetical protein
MDDLAELLRHAEERGIDLSQLAKKQNGDVRNTKENRRLLNVLLLYDQINRDAREMR